VPLQNRVDPYGRIVAVPERGTMLGNRGKLHDAQRRLVRQSRLDRWICCQLNFRGRHRTVMHPRSYTELFFLDEATAFAAGHRPCAECRRPAYQRFRQAWVAAGLSAEPPAAAAVDTRLAAERHGAAPATAAPAELPDGVLVDLGGRPHLCWRGRLLAWDWAGYRVVGPLPGGPAAVLTPRSTVEVLRAGYPVAVHPSADTVQG
jgi:hypothetical protein